LRYRHAFRVRAPLATVAAFHARPESLGAITPPPLFVRWQRWPARWDEGGEMAFTVWLGPLPVRWLARLERVSAEGFTDRQVRGPFRRWVHRHRFLSVDEETTEVRDELEAELRRHPFWGPVGLGLWLGLPVLFAYRSWRTRRLLEGRG